MSFSTQVKAELCRAPLNRKCCAQAEAYGVLLYCSLSTPTEVRITTAGVCRPAAPTVSKGFSGAL